MKTTLPYSTDYEPPCPVLTVRVARPPSGTGVALLGVVDTGADMTLIPERVARSLDLPVVSRIRVAGVTGSVETADVVAALIELPGESLVTEAVALGEETIVGRDLLHRLVLLLDGPRGTLELHPEEEATPRSAAQASAPLS